MVHVEFTIEPFIEGEPGLHVTAAIAAARNCNVTIDVGPFGSSCDVPLADVGALLAALTDAALSNGASHVSVHAENMAATPSPDSEAATR